MAASLSVPHVKIEDLCRTCLSRDDELHPLFSAKCGTTTLDSVITSITGIKVQPNDGLPTSICSECKGHATNAFEFKKKSQESNATLQRLIKTDNSSYNALETKSLVQCPTFEIKIEQGGYNDSNFYDMDMDYTALSALDDDFDSDPVKEEHGKGDKYQCDFCSAILESEEKLKTHLNNCCLKVEFTGDTGSYCPLCGVCYENCKNLTKHMWESHADLMGPKKRGRPKSLETNTILSKLSENGFRIKAVNFKKFNCPICRKFFTNKDEIVKHVVDHQDTKVYSCLLCKKMFLKESKFDDHSCTNNKNKDESSDVTHTGETFEEITLRSILGRVDDPDSLIIPHVCSRCSQIFASSAELRCHVDDDHPEQSLRCSNCLKVFASLKGAVRHRKVCKHVEKSYQCGTCGVKFAYEITLNKHILRFHEGESVSVNFMDPTKDMLEKRYQCDTCKKAFCRKDSLEKHFKVHLDKTIACDICHKLFHRKDNMKTHRKIHEPRAEVKLNTSLCLYCGRSFNNSSNLIVHMRRHTGEKPYKCDFCEKGFPRSSDLQCHRRSHTGERPCVCKICGKAFSRTNKLTRHMRVHTGVKPYKCTYCDKAFSQSNDLTLHVRRHTGDKPYICEVCGDRFIQGTALQNHRRAHGHFPATSSEPTAPLDLPAGKAANSHFPATSSDRSASLDLPPGKAANSHLLKLHNDTPSVIK